MNLLFVEYTESRTHGDGLKAQEREEKTNMKTPTLSRKSFDSRLSEKSQYSRLVLPVVILSLVCPHFRENVQSFFLLFCSQLLCLIISLENYTF